MFEATLHAADPDRQRLQRLTLAAAIAIASTSTMLAGMWTLERFGIDRVSGPSQQLEILQFNVMPAPKPVTPPPPPSKPEIESGGATASAGVPDDPTEVIEDPDPTPSNVLVQPRTPGNPLAKGPGIPGMISCPGGVCSNKPPTTYPPCTGPNCGTGPTPTFSAPPPKEVQFSALQCLACMDPDTTALRKAVGMQQRSGKVVVKFCVDANGRVEGSSVKVSRSYGIPAVDQITTAAIKQWRFSPMKVGGKAHRTCSRREFNIRFD